MNGVIVVTGASSGFGWEIAALFARKGYRVVAIARRLERLKALQASLPEADIFPLELDVRSREEVFGALSKLPAPYEEVDVLVNNAGLALGLAGPAEANVDDWETMLDTNIKGLLYVTRAVLPGMLERKKGYIFNVGSISANWPYKGGNVYGATKSFVKQFSLNIRADLLGTPIRVTCLEPGAAHTEFSEVRFKGDKERSERLYGEIPSLKSEDIAQLVWTCAQLPDHVNVNTLEVMPVGQAWGGYAFAPK